MRLIDADALKDEFCAHCATLKRYKRTVEECRSYIDPDGNGCFKMRYIDSSPTVDAVSVVRCKDCKHSVKYNCKNDACYSFTICRRRDGYAEDVEENDFLQLRRKEGGHTMNDNDIVNALWCCNNGLCEICPYLEEEEFSADCRERNGNDALDLINRLSTENERKDRILESYALQYGTVTDKEVFLRKARAEAIKEFAERLKAEATLQHGGVTVVYGSCIDNLVKEMKERNHET